MDGEERSVVAGVAQRVDQTHQGLDGVGAQGGRGRHDYQGLREKERERERGRRGKVHWELC